MKKVVALLMAGLMVVSMVGCGGDKTGGNGGKKGNNGGTEVELKYWNSGNGTEWLERIIDEFNEKQSDWYVTYTASASSDAVLAAYGQSDIDTADLYLTPAAYDFSFMEPLESILDETAIGDSKTLREKFSPQYLELETAPDGHIYTLTSGGSSPGIVYNKKLFDEAGIEVLPRTTKELAVVCDELLGADITPWAHFQNGGYYDRLRTIWQVQYDGYDYYNNTFIPLKDASGNSPSLEVLTNKDGRYQAIVALEEVLTTENVLPGSNSYDHITVQTMLLKERIGMMVNGAWLGTEMASVGDVDDFRMMKTPVISSITDKLTTVSGDSALRKLVSAIDAVTDGEKTEADYQSGEGYEIDGQQVSKEDWDYVRAARNTIYTDATASGYFIPNYSAEKEGAKEFLRFIFSDAGMEVQQQDSHGASFLAYSDGREIDTSDWNEFEKSAMELTNSGENIVTSVYRKSASKLFSMGITDDFARVVFIPYLCATNETDKKSADEIWDEIVEKYESFYDSWMQQLK